MTSPQNTQNALAESAAATNTANDHTAKLLFDIREAAARLSISVVSVRKLIRQKRLKRVPDFRKVLKAIGAKLAVPRQTDVEMFNASIFTISAYSIGILTFSREVQLSPPSALMGGQFPNEKKHGAATESLTKSVPREPPNHGISQRLLTSSTARD